MTDQQDHLVLTFSCKDKRGIVAAVTNFINNQDGFIIEASQFGDPNTKQFFLRMEFATAESSPNRETLRSLFDEQIAKPFEMDWQIRDMKRKQRVLILVSKHGHCLNDLLHRHRTGALPIEIVGVVSNHEDMRGIVEWHEVPYFYLPVTAETKQKQEAEIFALVQELEVDLVVLARYMQILSADLSQKLAGRAINIHHSFLPSFKGAKPYHQAYERGVKIIGATAHYVTDDLDEGPIISQEVAHVDHAVGPDDLVSLGRDIESVVLARAVKYHAEHRVLINGHKTVVFK